jgi:hypothetical protein
MASLPNARLEVVWPSSRSTELELGRRYDFALFRPAIDPRLIRG